MAEESYLQCYHKGCGQKYDPANNKEGSCKFHPGEPVFHDALKGWSCCKKRSTDFTEFLNIPGCTSGVHSNEKPAPPEEQPKANDVKEEVVAEKKPQQTMRKPEPEPMARPDENEPRVRLPVTVGDTLKQALQKQMGQLTLQDNGPADVVKKGTVCKRSGCSKSYEDESSNNETCIYHSGVPIFHEGMKYWSCCQRKTSDFNNFLSQEGCQTGQHLWFKADTEAEKKSSCRIDWHQTASHVTVSVFAKVANPEKSWVEVNHVSLNFSIEYEGGKLLFSKCLILRGVIDPSKSSVKMLGTKIEVKLKKFEPGSWPSLEMCGGGEQ